MIFLPIEILPREGLSRLLLAYRALQKGIAVCVGEQGAVLKLALHAGSGVYFDKSLSPAKYQNVVALCLAGIRVVSIDEEGLAHENNARVFKLARVHEPSVALVDSICTWGEAEREAWKQYTNGADPKKFVVTGNPRIDLASPVLAPYINVPEVNTPSEYVLITSNHGVNNANGFGFLRQQAQLYGFLKTDDDWDDFTRRLRFQYLTFLRCALTYERMVRTNPRLTFVFRPHPSENVAFWLDYFRPHKNCLVVYDDNYFHWLRNASVVVHSSCTSGIFCHFMGVPAIAYLPYAKDPYANFIANDLSLKSRNYKELQGIVRGILDKSIRFEMTAAISKKLNKLVFTECNSTATERIVTHLQSVLAKCGPARALIQSMQTCTQPSAFHRLWRRVWSRFVRRCNNATRQDEELFVRDKMLAYSEKYSKQSFSGLNPAYVDEKLRQLRQILGPVEYTLTSPRPDVCLLEPIGISKSETAASKGRKDVEQSVVS